MKEQDEGCTVIVETDGFGNIEYQKIVDSIVEQMHELGQTPHSNLPIAYAVDDPANPTRLMVLFEDDLMLTVDLADIEVVRPAGSTLH